MVMTQEEQILEWIRENPSISQKELAERAGISRSTAAVHISNLTKKGLIAGKGYIVRDSSYVVVVGGANVDIGGISYAPLTARDSNPGRVSMSLGGVGRNIAHNMALLGLDTRLVTALGADMYSQRISDSCSSLNIDISRSLRLANGRTSVYLFISDDSGEMQLGLSDMDIYENLTPKYLEQMSSFLDGAKLVVIDTNIPEETIKWLALNCRAPILVDPVSTAKAMKAADVLGNFHAIKPNRIEAGMLSGIEITDDESLGKCAERLLEKGLNQVFISLGGEGVYAASGDGERIKLPCFQAKPVNSTGCGDAFTAALAWSFCRGLGLEESARAGLAAAACALEAGETINSALCEETLMKRAGISRSGRNKPIGRESASRPEIDRHKERQK